MSKQTSITSFISKQGGGDDESSERKRNEKRKLQQKNYDKGKRQRTVSNSWLSEFDWANYDEENNTLSCKVCRSFPKLADTKSTLYTGVTSKFKKETLRFHAKSQKHIKCVEHKQVVDNPGTSSIKQSVRKADEHNSKKYEHLMNISYYIAQEGEALSKFPGLCDLHEKNGVQIGTNYRNRQACTNFISSISETIRQETVECVNGAQYVSVLCDGATDKSIREQEIVYIRFVDKEGKLCTKLADVVELDHGNAPGVKQGVLAALNKVGLPIENLSNKLVGINTDGASVNMGKKGGAVKILMEDIDQHRTETCEKYMTVVHCIAHNLELAVCDSKKGCKYLDRFEEVLKGIFKFYYYSPKKRRELYDIAVALEKDVKHYGGVQQVRWVASQKRALQSLLDNYEVTCVHLEEIASKKGEDSARASGYLQEIKSERFLVFLHFLIDWVALLTAVSESFQLSTCLVAEVSRKVNNLKDDLLHMKTRRGKILRKFLKTNEEGDEFRGIQIVRGGQRRNTDSLEQINVAIDSLLDDSVFFIEERFIKHLGGEPHSLFSVFDFKLWPDKTAQPNEFRDYGDEEMEKLVNMYSEFLPEGEGDTALDQWLGLKNHVGLDRSKPLLSAYEGVLALGEDDNRPFCAMLPLIRIMLTVSPSTAQCERGFSAMNSLKTQGRTSLKQDSLSNLLRIKVDGPHLLDFEAKDSLVTWLNAGRGTRHVAGHKLSGPRGPRARSSSSSNSSDTD